MQWSKEKHERTNKFLQNITRKTKDRASRTALKTGDEHRYFGRVSTIPIMIRILFCLNEPLKNSQLYSCAPEGQAVLVPPVASVALLLNDTMGWLYGV